jgi:serine/threonine protein kinase
MLNQILIGRDRYQLIQELGSKNNRATFLAKNLALDELVIIKILKFDDDLTWEHFKLFEREAETLKSLSHPAIPNYRDYFETNLPDLNGFALVQEYISAKSLKQHRIAGLKFTEPEVKKIASKLLEILIYLHQQKPPVIHRDIKPSNVLLNDRSGHSIGKVYLVDFGSVQNIGATQGSSITIVGTYGYMPPEQFGGQTTPASDIYSLGATLIYLLTGQHPANLPQKNLRIQFEGLTQLTPGFERWLQKAIAPDPQQRFSSAKAALKALQSADTVYVPPVLVEKPFGSKIKLLKNEQKLEILFPSRRLQSLFTCLFGLILFGPYFYLIWSLISVPLSWLVSLLSLLLNILLTMFHSGNFLQIAIASIFSSIALWFIVKHTWIIICRIWHLILFDPDGRVKLQIDRQQINWTYTLFGFKYQDPKPCLIRDIKQLFYSDPYVIKSHNEGWSYTKVLPSITIATDDTKYQIKDLTSPEVDWLGKELSQRLSLPFKKD